MLGVWGNEPTLRPAEEGITIPAVQCFVRFVGGVLDGTRPYTSGSSLSHIAYALNEESRAAYFGPSPMIAPRLSTVRVDVYRREWYWHNEDHGMLVEYRYVRTEGGAV